MKAFDPTTHALNINRRAFLTQSAYGLGGMAMAGLAPQAMGGVAGGMAQPHTPGKREGGGFFLIGGGGLPPGGVCLGKARGGDGGAGVLWTSFQGG
ncbi:MAG TPA: hypothetical protein DCP71_14145, partial [Verrucomicrobiales bacterium]|nr:hypothetical protein [Verrucomicrobiales bacterium]